MNGFELVLSQEYDSLLIARKIEMKIRNLKRKDCMMQKMRYIGNTPKVDSRGDYQLKSHQYGV